MPPAEYFKTKLQNGSRLLDKDKDYQIQRKEEIPECVEGSGQEPRRRLSQRGEEQKAGEGARNLGNQKRAIVSRSREKRKVSGVKRHMVCIP